MREITLAGMRVSDHTGALVIAEAGHNHGGDPDRAEELARSALASGADMVKFQTRHPREVYSQAEYGRRSDNPQWMDPVYGKHREKLEFTHQQWGDLFAYCLSIGITPFSTPFDFRSVDMLRDMGVSAYKVASGDATNIPLIEYIADIGRPMLISTGGCTSHDVQRIEKVFSDRDTPHALLHCSCIYPAPANVLNLSALTDMKTLVSPRTVLGLSSHYPSWEVALPAYALGARIFEFHFTVDRKWKGTDNVFSLEPPQMRSLVDGLRVTADAMGHGYKMPDPTEDSYTTERRKKVVAARAIRAGHVITGNDLAYMCPASLTGSDEMGIPPYERDELIGSVAVSDIEDGADVTWGALSRV